MKYRTTSYCPFRTRLNERRLVSIPARRSDRREVVATHGLAAVVVDRSWRPTAQP